VCNYKAVYAKRRGREGSVEGKVQKGRGKGSIKSRQRPGIHHVSPTWLATVLVEDDKVGAVVLLAEFHQLWEGRRAVASAMTFRHRASTNKNVLP
jgi:hypothetical protein